MVSQCLETKISLIIPACNQGDWLRKTVTNALESLGDEPHEIVVVDDQSTDGCCRGLPREVIVALTDSRLGVSRARHFGTQVADGGILLFSDPHCIYPGNSLKRLAQLAQSNYAIVQPPTNRYENSTRIAWGGRIIRNERGVALGKAPRGYRHVALINTIYALQRRVYDDFGGWPQLPGCWGYSEQAMSLLVWIANIPVVVADTPVCTHLNYQVNKKLPFFVSTTERATNGHYVHRAFLPSTYEGHWRPILLAKYGRAKQIDRTFDDPMYKQLVEQIEKVAIRKEQDVYKCLLTGVDVKKTGDEFVKRRQKEIDRRRATPYNLRHTLDWFINSIPGCIKGRSVLDLGTADGLFLDELKDKGVRHCEGIDVVPTNGSVKKKDRIVRQGDFRNIPDPAESWDIVSCVHSLDQIPEPAVAIREAIRVLRPGGWLFVAVPKAESFPDAMSLKRTIRGFTEIDSGSVSARAVKNGSAGKYEIRMVAKKQPARRSK